MTQPNKIWKKCIARRMLTDYSTTPPSVKEWIQSETVYDEVEDVMIFKEFDQDGTLINEQIQYDELTHFLKYNKNGEIASEEVIEDTKNDRGNFEMSSIDLEGKLKEEKLEYDERGRCVKKLFLEDGKVDSWLEFEYDNQDRVIKTKEFENGKLQFYEEDVYVSNGESTTLRYNSYGILTLRTDYKKLSDKNTYINSYYNDDGKLIRTHEEDRDEEDHVLEQRVLDSNNELKLKTIFGEDDEFGFRTSLKEQKYKNGELIKEVITRYEYEY